MRFKVNENYMSHVMRKRSFAYIDAKTKAQISLAVIAKLISAFVFVTQMEQFLYIVRIAQFLYIQNFKVLTFLWDCAGQFVLDRVGTTQDPFYRVAVHRKLARNLSLFHNSFRISSDVDFMRL